MDSPALIASGGAGVNIAASRPALDGIPSLAVGTDEGRLLRARKEAGLRTYLTSHDEVLGWEHVDPAVASHFVAVLPREVKGPFTSKLLIHVCGLGGATGTGVATALTRLRSGLSRPTLHLAVLPFGVERQRAARAAEAAKLLASDSTLIVFPNDAVSRAAPDLPFHECLGIANALVMEVARGLCALGAESLEKISRERGEFSPVLGKAGDPPPEALAPPAGVARSPRHLLAPPGAEWLAELRSKLESAGEALESHPSASLAANHWLLLRRA
jgi:hypothetical protein